LNPRLQIHRPELAAIEPPARFPEKLSSEVFLPWAYRMMCLSRRLEERLLELYQKGYVKGTVTISIGNEATAIGMTAPFRPGKDPVSLLHRDFGGHLVLGTTPYAMACQYLANADSPTHGREGNVHHGDARQRRFPMISHLGKMLSVVVGATWSARREGEDVFGLAVIGDGGSSTGEFHEALNLAAVHRCPVLFLVENNRYSFSTPTSAQYCCQQLSDRAKGYGIQGRTIDGTDVWGVYRAVCEAMEAMQAQPAPMLLECMSVRLHGHAAYDKAAYVSAEEAAANHARDPLPAARRALAQVADLQEAEIEAIEKQVEEEVQTAILAALEAKRPVPPVQWHATARAPAGRVKPYSARRVKNGEAVNRALAYLLENYPQAFLIGLDVGRYGSAFKTCKGLFERFGAERVLDMPLCESAIVGFALGASQTGAAPIVEFQFADFSTEAATQIGLNAATWFFRSGCPAPLLLRLPCGGGLTMGAFHSGEFEGLWSRFPGLKLLYPATAQETFEALVAGFCDPNPCLVLEHKQLYWSNSGDIEFRGDLATVWSARRYREGNDLTVVSFGAMVHEALAAADQSGHSVEVWNPFVVQPLDMTPILNSVAKTGRLLVVQESGETQGLGDRIIALAARSGMRFKSAPRLLAAPDMPMPFAPELELSCRPNRQTIGACIDEMLQKERLRRVA